MKALAVLVALAGCRGDDAPPPDDKLEAKPEGAVDHVSVSERVATEAKIVVAPLEMAALPATVDLTGEVAADPDHVAKVPVRVAGRVVAVAFQEGQRVAVGDILATIESGEVARIRADLTATSTRADAARKRAARLVELVALGTASTQDLESARAEAAALDADVAAARQTLSSIGGGGGATARLQIRSPLAGVITKRDGVIGQPVGPDHVIAEIVDLDHAMFLARLFEHDLARVHEGVTAEVTLDAYPDMTFTGKVITIGRQVEPIARAVLARIAIDDRDAKLKIGLFGTVHVAIPDPITMPPWPVAPTSAIAQIDERTVVFVETAPREFVVREVSLGHATGGKVEITKGVQQGERVAIGGLVTLKSLALASTFGEED